MKYVGAKNGEILFLTDYEVDPAEGVTVIPTFDRAHLSSLEIINNYRIWRGALLPKDVRVSPDLMRIAFIGKMHDNPLSPLNYRNLSLLTDLIDDWRLVPTPDLEWLIDYAPDYVIGDLDSIPEDDRDRWEDLIKKITTSRLILRVPLDKVRIYSSSILFLAWNQDEKKSIESIGYKSVLIPKDDVAGTILGILTN